MMLATSRKTRGASHVYRLHVRIPVSHIGFPRISAEYDTLVTVTLREALGYVGWSEECTVSTLTGAGTAGWETQLTPHSQSVSFTIWQSDSEESSVQVQHLWFKQATTIYTRSYFCSGCVSWSQPLAGARGPTAGQLAPAAILGSNRSPRRQSVWLCVNPKVV